MAAITRSTKFSPALSEASELRARNLGYPSWNAYIKALVRYDLMIQGEHTVTRPISHLRPIQQDSVDGELLGLTRAGTGVRGQWLEHAIARIVSSEQSASIAKSIGDLLVSKDCK
jgi:hypothetical protein